MINRMTKVALGSARHLAKRPGAWALVVRDTITGFRITAHHTLMTAGIAALGALGILYFNPQLTDHIKAVSPFASPAPQLAAVQVPQPEKPAADLPKPAASIPAAPSVASAVEQAAPQPILAQGKQLAGAEESRNVVANPQQKRVTAWLAKRYRVATDATNMLVSAAYVTAKEIKLDPLLILAVVAIESRFNPFAESPVGAQGLMQVMSKVHRDKFQDHGGIKAALNPVANIKVGSLILKDYVKRGGSVEAGLKLYVGAADSETDSGYGSKVLAEYRKLQEVASGKQVPTTTAARTPQKSLDRTADDKSDALTKAEKSSAGQPA